MCICKMDLAGPFVVGQLVIFPPKCFSVEAGRNRNVKDVKTHI